MRFCAFGSGITNSRRRVRGATFVVTRRVWVWCRGALASRVQTSSRSRSARSHLGSRDESTATTPIAPGSPSAAPALSRDSRPSSRRPTCRPAAAAETPAGMRRRGVIHRQQGQEWQGAIRDGGQPFRPWQHAGCESLALVGRAVGGDPLLHRVPTRCVEHDVVLALHLGVTVADPKVVLKTATRFDRHLTREPGHVRGVEGARTARRRELAAPRGRRGMDHRPARRVAEKLTGDLFEPCSVGLVLCGARGGLLPVEPAFELVIATPRPAAARRGSASQYSQWEHGRTGIEMPRLLDIAVAFDVLLDTLVYGMTVNTTRAFDGNARDARRAGRRHDSFPGAAPREPRRHLTRHPPSAPLLPPRHYQSRRKAIPND